MNNLASRKQEANILDWNIAKAILMERANGHEVTEEEMMFLTSFLKTELNLNKETQEDVGLLMEHFLEENDIQIFDEFMYYQELMA